MELLTFFEQLAPIAALRMSRWTYAAVNGSHILGLACLVGAMIAADLRLIFARPDDGGAGGAGGDWRGGFDALLTLAGAGFVLAVTTGAMMFATRATEYVFNPPFLIKLALIVAALANAVLFARYLWRPDGRSGEGPAAAAGVAEALPRVSPALRVTAAVSLILWICILFAGRLIAFVD
jgi:hypothetical protein